MLRKPPRGAIYGLIAVALATIVTLTGCAWLGAAGDDFKAGLVGISATMTTYDENGQQIDRVHGKSFDITRDTKFDTSNSDGTSKNDSSVLLISLGKNQISHVGSSLTLVEDGVVDLTPQMQSAKLSFNNAQPGSPWLNNFLRSTTDLWKGKARTLLIRSQTGAPIAIYAGNEVSNYGTEVPKSTYFRVDGKTVFVYRSDYTVYDNTLLN